MYFLLKIVDGYKHVQESPLLQTFLTATDLQ